MVRARAKELRDCKTARAGGSLMGGVLPSPGTSDYAAIGLAHPPTRDLPPAPSRSLLPIPLPLTHFLVVSHRPDFFTVYVDSLGLHSWDFTWMMTVT